MRLLLLRWLLVKNVSWSQPTNPSFFRRSSTLIIPSIKGMKPRIWCQSLPHSCIIWPVSAVTVSGQRALTEKQPHTCLNSENLRAWGSPPSIRRQKKNRRNDFILEPCSSRTLSKLPGSRAFYLFFFKYFFNVLLDSYILFRIHNIPSLRFVSDPTLVSVRLPTYLPHSFRHRITSYNPHSLRSRKRTSYLDYTTNLLRDLPSRYT